ncbi:iron chelate uptake ABC transporter family permease subunit [Streptomyces rhizosphaericola]|uniref:iron chelate uptake ABC transporter family permease subunit n=1 Tax=Streptomyces rhizosphaericola TaxID=2564098 RepID=UPI0039F0B7F4
MRRLRSCAPLASRVLGLLVAVGLGAVAVSVAGSIVFAALCVPRSARRLSRGTGTGPLPAAAMGALLLSASDLVAITLRRRARSRWAW